MGQLSSIQQDLVSHSQSVTTALRKAQILAYSLDNQEFKTWVFKELNGYPWKHEINFDTFIDSLPDYRKGIATIRGNLTNRFYLTQNALIIPGSDAPKPMRTIWLGDGVASIERILEQGHENYRHKLDGSELLYLQRLSPDQDVTIIDAWKELPRHFLVRAVESIKERLLLFTLELKQMYPRLDDENPVETMKISNASVSHLVQTTIYNLHEGATMTTFDQRNQLVNGNQYNAGENINFGNVQSTIELAEELGKLKGSLQNLGDQVDEETATDLDYEITKAIQQSKKENPDKSAILSHLNKVKTIGAKIAGLASFVVAIDKAIEVIDKII